MATEWDDLSNSDVWRNQTQYDARKWDNEKNIASVKFCAVPWDSEYKDVVLWESEEERNKYFDNKEGYVANESTGWNFKSLEVFKPFLGQHVGTIRTNIVYEDVLNFNFVAIEMYPQPTGTHERERRERFFYFLKSSNKINANTTEISLDLDLWTTYINSVSFSGMEVRRGHYTHALTNADKFLSNPLENHYGITDIEPELPDLKPLVSNERLISFSKNSPRICIATTADFSKGNKALWTNIANINNVNEPTANISTPGDDWWYTEIKNEKAGYNNYAPKPNVGDNSFKGQVAGGVNVYSIAPNKFNEFVNVLRKKYPQVIKTIKGFYVLDSSLIDEGAQFNFLGYDFKKVTQQNSYKIIEKITLNKDMFDYDIVYRDFAKLYTAQFSNIEISNLQGKIVDVAIEDVAKDLEFYSRASSAFPFLKLEAFINGIGGNNKKTYAVKPLNSMNAELFSSSWEDFKFDLEIPVYGVFVEAAELEGPSLNAESYKKINKNYTDYSNTNEEISTMDTNNKSDIKRKFDISVKDYNTISEMRTNDNNRDFSNDKTSIKKFSDVNIKEYDRDLFNSEKQIDKDYENEADNIAKSSYNDNKDIQIREEEFKKEKDNIKTSTLIEYNNIKVNNKKEYERLSIEANEHYHKYLRKDIVTSDTYYERMIGSDYGRYMDNVEDYYYKSQSINQYMAYLNLYSAWRQAQLNVAVNGFSQLSNAIGSAAGLNAAGVVTSAMSYFVNESAAEENYSINSNQLTQTYNIMNSSEIPYSGRARRTWDWPKQWSDSGGNGVNLSVSIGGDNYSYSGWSMGSISYHIKANEEHYRMRQAQSQVVLDSTIYINSMKKILEGGNSINGSDSNSIGEISYDGIYSLNKSVERTFYDEWNDFASRIGPTSNRATYSSRMLDYLNSKVSNNVSKETKINKNTKSKNTSIAGRNWTAASEINNITVNADTSVANRNKNTNEENISLEKNRYKYSSDKNKKVDSDINNLDISTRKIINKNEYENNLKEFAADALSSIYGEPLMFGENSGNAWVDSWGNRGLDLRIKRCSKPTEKIAGNMFYRYGYRTSGVWVDEPELSLMNKFTYWEAEQVWVVGERINETSKGIIAGIFEKGVTIWNKPEEVRNVDITTNTIKGSK